jgi:hypothetical protein
LNGKLTICLVLAAAFAFAPPASAQQTDPAAGGYGPIEAGRDAHAYHEALRLRDVNRHLWLLDQMRWQAAWPYGPWYFRSPAPGLDEVYAHGAPGRVPGRVFEPWPVVPGDLYGYRLFNAVPQSIGQRHVQTGPNRWESHPVYPQTAPPAGGGVPARPRREPSPAPAVKTPDAAAPAKPSTPPATRGPVEF